MRKYVCMCLLVAHASESCTLRLGSSQVAYGMCDVPSLRVLEREVMNELTGGTSCECIKLKARLLLVTLGF